jgi:hypothetical protein
MREVILYGMIVLFGLAAVNGVGITTFLLGEHLFHSQEVGSTTGVETDSTGRMDGISPEASSSSNSKESFDRPL